jgi:hypothetical protein
MYINLVVCVSFRHTWLWYFFWFLNFLTDF